MSLVLWFQVILFVTLLGAENVQSANITLTTTESPPQTKMLNKPTRKLPVNTFFQHPIEEMNIRRIEQMTSEIQELRNKMQDMAMAKLNDENKSKENQILIGRDLLTTEALNKNKEGMLEMQEEIKSLNAKIGELSASKKEILKEETPETKIPWNPYNAYQDMAAIPPSYYGWNDGLARQQYPNQPGYGPPLIPMAHPVQQQPQPALPLPNFVNANPIATTLHEAAKSQTQTQTLPCPLIGNGGSATRQEAIQTQPQPNPFASISNGGSATRQEPVQTQPQLNPFPFISNGGSGALQEAVRNLKAHQLQQLTSLLTNPSRTLPLPHLPSPITLPIHLPSHETRTLLHQTRNHSASSRTINMQPILDAIMPTGGNNSILHYLLLILAKLPLLLFKIGVKFALISFTARGLQSLGVISVPALVILVINGLLLFLVWYMYSGSSSSGDLEVDEISEESTPNHLLSDFRNAMISSTFH